MDYFFEVEGRWNDSQRFIDSSFWKFWLNYKGEEAKLIWIKIFSIIDNTDEELAKKPIVIQDDLGIKLSAIYLSIVALNKVSDKFSVS